MKVPIALLLGDTLTDIVALQQTCAASGQDKTHMCSLKPVAGMVLDPSSTNTDGK